MAGVALGCNVLAQQRIFGVLVMIELGGFPLLLAVASRTFLAQSALMNIILAVARNTSSGCFLFVERPLVASQAFHRFMLAQQLEFGFVVMVELDVSSRLSVWQVSHFLPYCPLCLSTLMASHTFMRRTFIAARVSMAFAAFHFYVFATESKAGLFETVIEFCFLPITLVMAAFTIGAQATLVLIILAMTVIAC